MDLTITLIGVVVMIVAIWVFLELKRARHRLLAIFLIGLLLFLYFSFTFVFHNKPLDLSSINGITQAGGTYATWLGSVFVNFKSITANVVNMNWGGNVTVNSTNSSG
jgi:hypothetical protein